MTKQPDITKLKIDFAKMEKDIDSLSATTCRIETKLTDYIEKDEKRLEEFKNSLDERYASKRIEKIVDGLGWLIAIAVFGALIATVIH